MRRCFYLALVAIAFGELGSAVLSAADVPKQACEVIVLQRQLLPNEEPPRQVFGVSNPLKSNVNFQTTQVSMRIRGREVYWPAVVYADLYNLRFSSLSIRRSGGIYFIRLGGSDGEKGYGVIFLTDARGNIMERRVTAYGDTQVIKMERVKAEDKDIR